VDQLMLDTIEITRYLRPPSFAVPSSLRDEELNVLRKLRIKARAELDAQATLFEHLLAETAASDANPGDLVEIASLVQEKELKDEDRLRPTIEKIETTLAGEADQISKDAALLLVAVLFIFLGWLSLHRDVREGLLKLAEERQARSKEASHAKPAKGEVDHGTLTDNIIARFPNILKALAE
jgi:hypothetical protein